MRLAAPEPNVDTEHDARIKRMAVDAGDDRKVIGVNTGRFVDEDGCAATDIELVGAHQFIMLQEFFRSPLV